MSRCDPSFLLLSPYDQAFGQHVLHRHDACSDKEWLPRSERDRWVDSIVYDYLEPTELAIEDIGSKRHAGCEHPVRTRRAAK